MPAKYSHNTSTVFSVFILFAFALQLSCVSHESQTFSPKRSAAIAMSPGAVNINTADAEELQKIPGIGPASAKKIIDHRNRYGPFRRPEEILIIEGISDRRFREFRRFIFIE